VACATEREQMVALERGDHVLDLAGGNRADHCSFPTLLSTESAAQISASERSFAGRVGGLTNGKGSLFFTQALVVP
jgi:hypothetical protein